jgi:hypothetical protein
VGGNAGAITSQINLNSAGSFSGDHVSILSTPFAASGPAVIALTSASNLGSTTQGGSFNGSTIVLLNANGVIARDAAAAIIYTGISAEHAVGGGTASRNPVPGG